MEAFGPPFPERLVIMKVVVINGYPQSGKDLFVQFCQDYSQSVSNLVSSTPAKKALKILGWDGREKSPEVRKALADVMEISEKTFDGVFKAASEVINRHKALGYTKILFVHSREPRNIERYKRVFGATTLFIQRDGAKQPYNNDSDNLVEQYAYDVVIENNGSIAEFKEKAATFVKELI